MNANTPMLQSELEATTCKLVPGQARENKQRGSERENMQLVQVAGKQGQPKPD